MSKELNVKLLRKAAANILRDARQSRRHGPAHFDMDGWARQEFRNGEWCGTTCCIAGRVVCDVLWEKPKYEKLTFEQIIQKVADIDGGVVDGAEFWTVQDYAEELLGLSESCGAKLWFTGHWPDEFQEAYGEAEANGDSVGMAKAAVARIKHFIATGK